MKGGNCMADEKVLTLTDVNFEEEVLSNDLPVLVDFWAAWCGPCKMVAPIIEEIARDYDGKIKVAKLNVDEYSNVASKYNIMSIPTIFLFKNGEPVEKLIGARSKDEFKEMIERHI
jgi:thioredoxin 1